LQLNKNEQKLAA